MHDDESDQFDIDAEAIDRIISYTGQAMQAKEDLQRELLRYLRLILVELVRHAPMKPWISKPQYQNVERRYLALSRALEQLQETAYPPPRLEELKAGNNLSGDPIMGWVNRVRFLDEATSEFGRRSSGNRDAAADFLAVYRRLYDREPSGNVTSEKRSATGDKYIPPSLRFVTACMREVRKASGMRGAFMSSPYFGIPSSSAFEKWFLRSGQLALVPADRRLAAYLRNAVKTE